MRSDGKGAIATKNVLRFKKGESYHLYSSLADGYYKRYERPRYFGLVKYQGRKKIKWSNPKMTLNLAAFLMPNGKTIYSPIDCKAYRTKIY